MLLRGGAMSWLLGDWFRKEQQLSAVSLPSLTDAADQEQSHELALALWYCPWSALWLCPPGMFLGGNLPLCPQGVSCLGDLSALPWCMQWVCCIFSAMPQP